MAAFTRGARSWLVGDKAEHVRHGKVFRQFARVRLCPSPGQECTLYVSRECGPALDSTDTADLAGLDLPRSMLATFQPDQPDQDQCHREVGEGDRCLRSADNTTICWLPSGSSEWCSRTSETGETAAGAMMWCDGHDVECYAADGCPCHDEDLSVFFTRHTMVVVISIGGVVGLAGLWLLALILLHWWCKKHHIDRGRAGTGTDQARREHQHVSEPDIGARHAWTPSTTP